jgi:predicted ATPase
MDLSCTPYVEEPLKSQSIPISKAMLRTASEVQLCEDEQLADQRDYVFYSRLVNGISHSQRISQNNYLRMENQICLAHIMQTRQDAHAAAMAAHHQQQQEEWAFSYHNSPVDKEFVHAMTTDALAIAISQEDEEGIFELDF